MRKKKEVFEKIKLTMYRRENSMTFEMRTQDLFTVPQGYYLAHCISGDFALGAGIAKQFVQIYNMREKLLLNYDIMDDDFFVGKALVVDNVFNLVTKRKYFHKPTYDNLRASLEDMRDYCDSELITKLAMPLIGCGLDGLSWDRVSEIIKEVFEDTDIDILICTL